MYEIKHEYRTLKKLLIKIALFILFLNTIQILNCKNSNIVYALNQGATVEFTNANNIKDPVLIAPSKGRVTSNFGERKGGKHHGIDIASKIGTPIKASCTGIVSKVDYHNVYGKRIIINHGNGVETLYAHCSNIFVKPNQKVSVGQYIANVGNTGKSTGPHIHFELRIKGKAVNPSNYIK